MYYVFATLFAQLAITLRLATPSDYHTPATLREPRVYAVTGQNRWIAFCLSLVTFVQAAFGMTTAIYFAFRPGMVSLLAL